MLQAKPVTNITNSKAPIIIAIFSLIFIILFSLVNLKLVSIGFILWGFGFWFNREKASLNDLLSGINKWFILYYLLLVAGMLWTDNQLFGLLKLENKLSFILFPLLFTFSKLNISKDKILAVFILGLVMSLIVNYSIAIYHTCVLNIPLFDSFFNVNFAYFMHHSYYGHYLIIGSLIALDRLINRNATIVFLLLFFVFSLGVIQTLSKSAILIYLLLIPLYFFWEMFTKKKYNLMVLGISFFIIFGYILINTENSVSRRLNTIPISIEEFNSKDNPSIESNTARLIMWTTSLDLFKESFIAGSGTGDYDDVLYNRNMAYGNTGVAKQRLNSHNQFLNTAVQLGIIGVIILSLLFFSGFRITIKQKKSLFFFCLLCFLLNFLFESFLETQAGIVLFCVLLISLISEKLNTNSNEIEYL